MNISRVAISGITMNYILFGGGKFFLKSPPNKPQIRCFLLLFIACAKNKKPRKIRALRGNSLCCIVTRRRKRDSNPWSTVRRTTVFKTAAFDRSAIPPWAAKLQFFLPLHIFLYKNVRYPAITEKNFNNFPQFRSQSSFQMH